MFVLTVGSVCRPILVSEGNIPHTEFLGVTHCTDVFGGRFGKHATMKLVSANMDTTKNETKLICRPVVVRWVDGLIDVCMDGWRYL